VADGCVKSVAATRSGSRPQHLSFNGEETVMKLPRFSKGLHTIGLPLAAIIGLALAGCATQRPPAPTVLALPAAGESFALFQQHETTCRQYALAQTGGQSPGQAGAQNGLASAALGTGIGAAAGALLGSASGHAGNGAAIGAGTGLLAGSMVGSASGRSAATSAQNSYNLSYTQCMVANGERVEPPPSAPAVVYRAPPPPVIYMAPPAYLVPVPPAPAAVMPPPPPAAVAPTH
jgi:Glycine-zipper domain